MAIPLVLLLTFVIIGPIFGCHPRDYGNGGTVCVCTKDYCDTYNPVTALPGGYEMYTSSLQGARLTRTSDGQLTNDTTSGNTNNGTLTIYRHKKMQKIFGFGGAFTDSAGINILSLSDATRQKLMESYYSENGIEYNMGRIPIAGTDFSTRGYTYDDVDGDYDLKYFALQEEDFKYKIPLIKIAKKLSKTYLKLFGTAWTAPAWMKTNGRLAGVGFLNLSMYDAWAEYHIKFLDAYRLQGVDLWGLTTGNEPANGYNPVIQINDMGWVATMHAQWIAENLGPRVRLNPNYENLKIMIVDDQRVYFPWTPRTIYENKIAKSYIDGAAVHYYLDTYVSPEVLSITHYDFPDKFILATEACEGSISIKPVILGSWDRAENYLNSIIDDLNNWATGWIDWNIALNTDGGPTYAENYVDSPILVNKTADEFYKQPMYYAVGHFAKYVAADSVRVHSSFTGQDLKSVAFERPDGGIVVQVFNQYDSDKTITIRDDETNDHMEMVIQKRSMNSILYWI